MPASQGDRPRHRREEESADEPDDEGYEAVHTSTSDVRPACTSTPAARHEPARPVHRERGGVVGGGHHLGGVHASLGERVGRGVHERAADAGAGGRGGDGDGEDLGIGQVAGGGGVPQRLDHAWDGVHEPGRGPQRRR